MPAPEIRQDPAPSHSVPGGEATSLPVCGLEQRACLSFLICNRAGHTSLPLTED